LRVKYNYKYQTSCDGESLIHLYNHGGIDFMVENLYGVFAFILLDTKVGKIYFGRDTFGVRPCYKMESRQGTLAICSENKGLISLKLPEGDRPRFSVVKPGHFEEYLMKRTERPSGLEVERASAKPTYMPTFIRSKQFHTIGTFPKYDVDVNLLVGYEEKTILTNIRNSLANAVRMRLMSQRRIGCMLSGGLDSSLIASLVIQESRSAGIGHTIQTFSVGMDRTSPDLIAAREVARFLNTEHHEIVFTFEEARESLRQVINMIESYDVSTIRSGIGQCCYLF
jgi:asparagine synthase (glutamine-hydrolysing)